MLIQGADVVFDQGVRRCDVRIEGDEIVEIGEKLDGEGIDGRGKYLMPSLVDIGIKVRDAKLRRGTLERLSKKAAVHGFGTIVLSARSEPPIDDEITLEFVKSQAELCQDAVIRSLIAGIEEEGGLSDCSILLKEGGVGIEFDSDIDGNLIRRLMEYAAMHGVTLFCHANDRALQGDGVMHEGRLAGEMGLGGISPLAESSQVARVGAFAKTFGVDVVILGASTLETLELCEQNAYLIPQVSLHHLLLNDETCRGYDTRGKLFPPLRDEKTRQAMLHKVTSMPKLMITSLHSPVSLSAKDAVFAEAAYGIDALPYFLPLIYSGLVEKGFVDMETLCRMVATNPSRTIGHTRSGTIAVGAKADVILFDPKPSATIDDETSPYHGWQIRGHVERVTKERV